MEADDVVKPTQGKVYACFYALVWGSAIAWIAALLGMLKIVLGG